jgi:regulatory protein
MGLKTSLRQTALNYLARREYTRIELEQKLIKKGFDQQKITELLNNFIEKNWLNDNRFVEAYLSSYSTQNYGYMRLRQNLRQRGVDEELINLTLGEISEEVWLERVLKIKKKRFGDKIVKTPQERAKQMRFLSYRGFTSDQIKKIINKNSFT